jgi:hypothetical protein
MRMQTSLITMTLSGVYACSFCGEAFASETELRKHVIEKHDEVMTISE